MIKAFSPITVTCFQIIKRDLVQQWKKTGWWQRSFHYNLCGLQSNAPIVMQWDREKNPAYSVRFLPFPNLVAHQWCCWHQRNLQLSQRVVSVDSSSLLHHGLFIDFNCWPWWHINERADLHASRNSQLDCLNRGGRWGWRFARRKTGLSPK